MNKKLVLIIVVILLVGGLLFFYIQNSLNKTSQTVNKPEVTQTPLQITPEAGLDYDEQFEKDFNEAAKTEEYKYTLSNGQEVTIKLPLGVDPPPQEAVEQLYQNR